jgi:hypothetical protein
MVLCIVFCLHNKGIMCLEFMCNQHIAMLLLEQTIKYGWCGATQWGYCPCFILLLQLRTCAYSHLSLCIDSLLSFITFCDCQTVHPTFTVFFLILMVNTCWLFILLCVFGSVGTSSLSLVIISPPPPNVGLGKHV